MGDVNVVVSVVPVVVLLVLEVALGSFLDCFILDVCGVSAAAAAAAGNDDDVACCSEDGGGGDIVLISCC